MAETGFPFSKAFPAGVAQDLVRDMAEAEWILGPGGKPMVGLMPNHEGQEMTKGDFVGRYGEAQDTPSAEPKHRHEWVLGRRESMRLWIKVTKPLWLRCTWICECGEAKVMEYEV